jgi:hypothetical protein
MNTINDEWMQYLSTQETGNISQILSQENRKIQSVYKRNRIEKLSEKNSEKLSEFDSNEIQLNENESNEKSTIVSKTQTSTVEKTNMPKCDELYISTKTKVLFLNQAIDLNAIFWKIPIIEYGCPIEGVVKKQMKIVSKTPEDFIEYRSKLVGIPYYIEHIIKQINNPAARRIKFKDERKITIGLSKKDIMNCRGKVKNAFYNCFALILRFRYEGAFKEIHVKIFNTGKLEIPGILNNQLLEIVKTMVLGIMQPNIESPVSFIENNSHDNVLINSNFSCGFYINRDKLHAILRAKYGIETAFDPCSYPGIKCKFYFNNELGFDVEQQNGKIILEDRSMKMSQLMDNKKYTEVSFMIFRTGSCLIVGNCSESILLFIFDFIKVILANEYETIRIENDGLAVKIKKPKIRKRVVSMTPEYYTLISS